MTVGVKCPRCGYIWISTSRKPKRKCRAFVNGIRCGKSCGRRAEIDVLGDIDV